MINDASTDDSLSVAYNFINSLPDNVKEKFKLINSHLNRGAVFNHITSIKQFNPDDNDILMLLDGDDSLNNNSDIFTYYNYIHYNNDFTYGSCWSMVDNIPLISQPYPPEVKKLKNYKDYKFNWNMPYTHLRTLKAKLLKYEPDSKFQDEQGSWFKAGGDNATFYTALEKCDPNRVYVVSDVVYNYNDVNPLNDYKVNREEQDRAIAQIVNNSLPTETRTATSKAAATKDAGRSESIKRILIAIPTNKNIEPSTFKSIYDQIVPEGYETTFQYFWGYQVDQVRNLIADWVINGNYDYLFSVDSDISFAPDTLSKMLSHNKDVVSGIYIQRIQGKHTIEIMRKNSNGGISHVNWGDINGQGLVPIDGCGFGCVLIKGEVFKSIPYPHFVYHSAIDHANTVSEDVHFCNQARDKGFTLWADTSIICEHTGSYTFRVDMTMKNEDPVRHRLKELRQIVSIPDSHFNYLKTIKEIEPKIIYDIGSCVLHWTDKAKQVWPAAQYFMFEAMDCCEFLYQEENLPYNIGVLSDQDNKIIEFYENKEHPGGNSYYRENPQFSPPAVDLFNDSHKVQKTTITLDSVVAQKNFPLPDLIKMDVQGAELDVLKGAQNTLKNCKDLILEIAHVEYNTGAPPKDSIINYVESLGFKLVTPTYFSTSSGMDGDYHFTRKIN